MTCCRCNRAGICRSCACVKAKRLCVNCLPCKQGNCANISTAIPTAIPNATSTPNALAPSTSTSSHTPHSVHAVNIVPAVLTAIQAGPPTTSISTPISAPCSSENTFAQQQPPTGSIQPAIVTAPQDPRSLEPLNFCWGEHALGSGYI